MDSFYIILVTIILITCFIGYKTGFIKSVFSLIKLTAALTAAYFFYEYTAGFFAEFITSSNEWLYPIAFITTCLTAHVTVSLLFIPINKMVRPLHLTQLNKAGGIIPGSITGLILVAILLRLIPFFSLPGNMEAALKNNKTADFIIAQSKWADEKLSPIFEKPFTQTIASATEHIIEEKAVTLPFVTDVYTIRYELEMQMLQMVNEERKKYELKPLLADPELCIVARKHSEDMFKRGYFSHNTPDGITPFERMHLANINYLTAGENLALAQTLLQAHRGLMNSAGHRANILNPRYGRMGIGILDGGDYGLMISQEFRD